MACERDIRVPTKNSSRPGRFLSEFKNTVGILSSSKTPWESRDSRVDETDKNFSQRDVRSHHVNAIVARCSRNAVYSCILVFLVTHHPCNTRACTRRAGGLDVFVMFLLEVPVFSFSLLKIPARSSARSPYMYGYAKGHAMLCGPVRGGGASRWERKRERSRSRNANARTERKFQVRARSCTLELELHRTSSLSNTRSNTAKRRRVNTGPHTRDREFCVS